MALKRITKEFIEITGIRSEFIHSVKQDEENIFQWIVVLHGPKSSLYEGGLFEILFEFPRDYPFKPPKITFLTKILHPDIRVASFCCCCTPWLYDNWSPAMTVYKILLNFNEKLKSIDNQCAVEQNFKEDKMRYYSITRHSTLKYADKEHLSSN